MLRVLPARCLTWRMYVVSYQKNWLPPVSIYPAGPVQVWQWLSCPVRGKDEETPAVAGGSSTYGSNLNKKIMFIDPARSCTDHPTRPRAARFLGRTEITDIRHQAAVSVSGVRLLQPLQQ
ncbi:uncharacterized protein LOC144166443 [Haemaphysalis longicornis]